MAKAVRGSPSVDKRAERLSRELGKLVSKEGKSLGLRTLKLLAADAHIVLAVKETYEYARMKQATAVPGGKRRRTSKDDGK